MNNTRHSAWMFRNDLPIGDDTRSMDTHAKGDIKCPVTIAGSLHGHT